MLSSQLFDVVFVLLLQLVDHFLVLYDKLFFLDGVRILELFHLCRVFSRESADFLLKVGYLVARGRLKNI